MLVDTTLEAALQAYVARPGSNHSNQTAQLVGPDLYGPLYHLSTDEAIAYVQQHPELATYGYLEWDDAIAGPEWRRHQYEDLRNSVRVVPIQAVGGTPEEDPVQAIHQIPVYLVNGPEDQRKDRRGQPLRISVNFADIKADAAKAHYAVDQAREAFLALFRRYRHLRDLMVYHHPHFGPVFAALEAAEIAALDETNNEE